MHVYNFEHQSFMMGSANLLKNHSIKDEVQTFFSDNKKTFTKISKISLKIIVHIKTFHKI